MARVKEISDSLTKLAWSLPWLIRYPFWRANEVVRRIAGQVGRDAHVIVLVANHFEPGYNEEPNEFGSLGVTLDWDTQLARVEKWCEKAQRIGEAVCDHDGTPFRHTYFYPAEQYHRPLLDRLAVLQSDGFGEVEIHLHHGVDQPDNATSLRSALETFRDILAEEHKCLSVEKNNRLPRYGFVHGNLALGNSAGGRFCGVDSELQILAETGCYADFTLPSAPDRTQVARINAIYQCGHPLGSPRPHRSGPSLRSGNDPVLPIIFEGPLVFDWGCRKFGLPVPRIDSGALTAKSKLDRSRFLRWRRAQIGILGRPEWVFVKLFCHGFFEQDQPATIGLAMQRFWDDVLKLAEGSGQFKLHFATAREAFNMTIAAVEGNSGNPHNYRDYRLRPIMAARPALHDGMSASAPV